MRFIIGFAGVPQESYDHVYKSWGSFASPQVEFVCKPLRRNTYRYDDEYSDAFLGEFEKRIRNDHQNKLSDTAFAIVAVQHDEDSTKRFCQHFFPSTLVITVDWKLDFGNVATVRNSSNELVILLRKAAKQVRDSLGPLKKELTERSNKTPLLLPLRNFRSKHLQSTLWQLHSELPSSSDKRAAIEAAVREFEREHPSQQDNPKNPSFFVDDTGIWFRAPGRDRHAFARSDDSEQHAENCVLAGRRRLGAPYDPAFHYDCTRKGKKLKGLFVGCHEGAKEMEGHPHLNIAPNDFVRS
jgi:hypothetical protein